MMSDPTPNNNLSIITSQPLDQNPAAVYLASMKQSSRRPQRQALEMMAAMLSSNQTDALNFPWAELRFQHTAAVRARLLESGRKPATVNRCLSALRGVLRAAWELGKLAGDDYQRAANIKSMTGESLPAGRELTAGEIKALMATCENDPTPAGVRDAAIIALMYSCGLRREEVIKLSIPAYDAQSARLIVHGKRDKERTAYLVNGAARAVADWLKVRQQDGDAMFCAINKGGKLDTSKIMTPQAIYNILAKRAGQAGVSGFSPHDLRRTFVSDLLEAGVDIATVAKMAGHSNIQTTARYDRRPEDAKRKAAGLLYVPYTGRVK